jgi:lipopolysaccharide/colanic/teichoic acid biosynthesis glycosyltransferase
MHAVAPPRFLARLRHQLFLGVVLAVALPLLVYSEVFALEGYRWAANSLNTAAGAVIAYAFALSLFRRFINFPGIRIWAHVMPAVLAGYGTVVAGFFTLRLDYSRVAFGLSFTMAALFLFATSAYLLTRRTKSFYVVPSSQTMVLPRVANVEWKMLSAPVLPNDRDLVLIADLRADMSEAWERLIADAALAGFPVYHVKQVAESLTGRVEIEHLSENSFGSLIPNSGYTEVKRFIDLFSAGLTLPLMVLPGLLVALLIKLDSSGPVFYRQTRRGYRGETFRVLKFRTMRVEEASPEASRAAAITQDGDARITRLGRFLRRTRIDELPQVWNIVRGEMSWIGPRPEALPLSDWYEAELPFYVYRHIVRPGITGWAQVNQGHVSDLEAVYEKLHYDFYYIKNFSAWLDLLIVARTISTVFTGFGSK